MARLRGRVERRASWWERDARVLAGFEAIANKRDRRWALVALVDGVFRVACTGTFDEVAGTQRELWRSAAVAGCVPSGRGFALYDPAGVLRNRLPAKVLDAEGCAVEWPATLSTAAEVAQVVARVRARVAVGGEGAGG